MIDFTKATTSQPEIISRLHRYALTNLQPHKPQNRNYICYSNGSGRFRIEFRKIITNGILRGFYNAELCFSPHYYFNGDLHNGNDFAPPDCVAAISQVIEVLGISETEMQDFKITNLEFGLNLNPGCDVKSLINGIIYTKRTPFRTNRAPHSKIAGGTKYKEIKAYAKGLQFSDNPEFGISPDCFRFEVRHKQHKGIRPLGIVNLSDLLDLGKYGALFQSLVSEWENILVINDEVKTAQNKPEFWSGILSEKHRDKFHREKAKYYKSLPQNFNFHHLIKCRIIDKIFQFQIVANSTHRTPINRAKDTFEKIPPQLINLEFATNDNSKSVNKPLCAVTGLDISMQKKTSKYLCSAGLKWYHENAPETYQKLTLKYLTDEKKSLPLPRQFYYIAHNIRNAKTNPNHNPVFSRKRFEKRHYHKHQLQFNF